MTVVCDGIARQVEPGGTVILGPGESITLPPYLCHAFHAIDGDALIGEVSSTNNDETDNYFHEPIGRYPQIEEDEPPLASSAPNTEPDLVETPRRTRLRLFSLSPFLKSAEALYETQASPPPASCNLANETPDSCNFMSARTGGTPLQVRPSARALPERP